jgi:hypothetical protein
MGVLRRALAPLDRLALHTPARQRYKDRSVVLLRYVGRRTGDIHERAVAVARDRSRLVAVSHRRAKGWWRDFQPMGPAVVVLDDVELGVTGRMIDGADQPHELAEALRAYLRWFPRAGRELGVRVATPAWADLEPFAPRFIAVVFDLDGRPTTR